MGYSFIGPEFESQYLQVGRGWGTSVFNASFREFDALFWPPTGTRQAHGAQTSMQAFIHIKRKRQPGSGGTRP